VKTIEKHNYRYFRSNYNTEEFTSLVDLDLVTNIFKNIVLNVRQTNDPKFLLKMNNLIEIGNNKIIKQILQGFEIRVIFYVINIQTLARLK